MFGPHFNSQPVIHRGQRRKPSSATVESHDFDPIDAGFEDIAAGPQDVQIAPGVVAHFGQYTGDTSNDRHYPYHSVPVLERIAE